MLSQLAWCSHCDVPLLGEVCSICGTRGKPINPDLRPIFYQEKVFLEGQFGIPLPWPLFYGSTGWLYHKNKTIGRMSLKEGQPRLKVNDNYKLFIQNQENIDEKYYRERVVEANSEILMKRENEAITFIQETVSAYPEFNPIVAFSGGKDSTVAAALTRKALGHANLFFGDTTIEFPDTYDYIQRLSETDCYSLHVEPPQRSFYDIVPELEPPSQSMRWCCTVVKATPLNTYLQKNPSNGLFFDGIRRHESRARENYERVSKNPKSVNQIVARPILNWTTMDVWAYIWWRELDYNHLYDKGYGRAGCMHCPYNTRYDNFLTKTFFPEAHNKWTGYLRDYFDAANSCRKISEEQKEFWIDYGWKHRLPHRSRIRVGTIKSWSETRKDIRLDIPVDMSLLEFLRPIGTLLVRDGKWFILVGGDVKLEGTIGGKLIKLRGTLSKHIMKAFHKYLNCVGCGGCVGICPSGAISIQNGKISISVDKCNNCGSCMGIKLLGSGCVSLTYRSVSQILYQEQNNDVEVGIQMDKR